MGQLLYNYRKSVIDNIKYNIQAEKDIYYAIATKIIPDNVNNNTETYLDVYSSESSVLDQLQFGKRIFPENIAPVIRNIKWVSNTVYDQFDDQDINLFNKDFYVVTDPNTEGGYRHIFKCLRNGNNSPSIYKPDLLQTTWFEKSDGYRWKYMYSVSQQDFDKWGTSFYIPVVSNNYIESVALESSGIDQIIIENKGLGYLTYNEGIIKSVKNNYCVQIDTSASLDNDFYKYSSIYMYNTLNQTGQILEISSYVSNTSGKWCILNKSANTSLITSGLTTYIISPTVKISGDSLNPAFAYSIVNNNIIDDIVIIDRGSGYSHATINIKANTAYGNGAICRPIIGPPGGHGSNPAAELAVKGMCFNIKFSNTENFIIPATKSYSSIGIIRNPKQSSNSSLVLVANAFSQIFKAYVSGNTTYTQNETVIGQTSGALGIVYHSNSSVIWLTGNKYFTNNEVIVGQTSNKSANIQILTIGDIWSKDLDILYINNINSVNRSPTQSETYKIIISV